jgi:tetratricopeptide (TPR) repeat protein
VTKKNITQKPPVVKKPLQVILNFPVKVKYAILIIISLCFYANSFRNEYVLDDEAVIQRNEYVQKGFSGIAKILSTDAYDSYYKQSNANQKLSGGRYRPLSIVLFAIEHQLWGESPHKRHAVNILLYILCVLSIFYFLRNYLFKALPNGEDIAFIAALLFAIHPLHTEVVANIKSSDEILSLLFIMLTFIFSINYLRKKKILSLLMGTVSLFLALLAKEYALTLVLLLPILFMLHFKEKAGKALIHSLPYAGVVILYFIVRISAIGFPHQQTELDILNNPYLLATPMQKLATEIFILGKYLWMLIVPYPLAYDYGFAQISYYSFSSPLVWLSILIYSGVIYGGIKLLRHKSILAFPVSFYLLNLFMISNFILNIGTTMGERLVFHSSLGFVMLLAWAIVYIAKGLAMPRRSYTVMGFLAFLVIVCGMETMSRNRDWKSNFTLFTKDVNAIPNSVKANDNAGAQYINLSEATKDTLQSDSIARVGLKYLNKAVRIDDSDIDGYLNMGIAYCKLIEPDSAKLAWDRVKQIYPAHPNLPGYYSLLGQIFNYTGNQFAKRGQFPQSINEFETGLQCAFYNPDLWLNLGGSFFNTNQYDSARHCWQTVQVLNPNYPNLANYLAMLPKQTSN